MRRLFLKLVDAAVRVGVHDAEAGCLLQGDVANGDGAVRAALLMIAEHLGIVHLVDVVAGKDQHVFRTIAVDEGDVLADGVCGALVPLGFLASGIRRQDLHAAMGAVQAPGLAVADVLVELQRLILGEDAHGVDAGIDAVGQRKVYDPVFSAEGYSRLGRVLRQYLQSTALPAGQEHCDTVFLLKIHSVSLSFLLFSSSADRFRWGAGSGDNM